MPQLSKVREQEVPEAGIVLAFQTQLRCQLTNQWPQLKLIDMLKRLKKAHAISLF